MRVTVEFTTGRKANQRRWDSQYTTATHPCWLCGVPVAVSTDGAAPHMVEAAADGCVIVDEQDPDDSLGWFPVGPDCYRKIQRAIKAARRQP